VSPPSTTDWITAIGSAFAAVGTVGAVIVALWQSREKINLKLDCFYREVPNKEALVLVGGNTRRTPVNIVLAGLESASEFYDATYDNTEGDLPTILGHKETVRVEWTPEELRDLEAKRGEPLWSASFLSEVDGAFNVKLPGGKHKYGWLGRRGVYVPPEHPPWNTDTALEGPSSR
jgi:hypothetical protein